MEKRSTTDIYQSTSYIRFEDDSILPITGLRPDQVGMDIRFPREPHPLKYWEYRKKLMETILELHPGVRIDEHKANHFDISLLRLFKNNPTVYQVKPRGRDKLPLWGQTQGISSTINFIDSMNNNVTNPTRRKARIVDAIFGRTLHGNDEVFKIDINKLEQTGYEAIWTPIKSDPLHVRVVSKYHEFPAIPLELWEHVGFSK